MIRQDHHSPSLATHHLAGSVVRQLRATGADQHRTQLRVTGQLHEREWSERVGQSRGDIFQQSHAAQQRVAQSLRPGSGRLVLNARRLWGAQGEQTLTQRTAGLRAHLRVAGPQALDELTAGDDPLTRLTLLQGLLHQLETRHPDRNEIQRRIDQLQADEGDAIQALENAASAFLDEAAGAATATATAATGAVAIAATATNDAEEAAALRRSYAALVGPRQRRQDRPLGALQLAQALLREVGADGFGHALAKLARGAIQDLAAPRPSRAAIRVQVAMTDASAFKTVRSLLAQVEQCSLKLQGLIPTLSLRRGEATAEVLRLAEQGIVDSAVWAAALAGSEHAADVMDSPTGLRTLRGFVAALPGLLWGSTADAGRLKTLVALDQHAIELSVAGPAALPQPGHGPNRLDPGIAAALATVRRSPPSADDGP